MSFTVNSFVLILFLSIKLSYSFAQTPSQKLCDIELKHPLDIKAALIKDSLKKTGVDTLLIYRHWHATNGYNGYAKVLWRKNGKLQQKQIPFLNDVPYLRMDSIRYSAIPLDTVFSEDFFNELFSVTENPTKQDYQQTHDTEHFVYYCMKNQVYCFTIKGILVTSNPAHIRCKLVRLLDMKIN